MEECLPTTSKALGPFLALGHSHTRILKATRQRRGEWMGASPVEQGRAMARLVDGKNGHCSEAGNLCQVKQSLFVGLQASSQGLSNPQNYYRHLTAYWSRFKEAMERCCGAPSLETAIMFTPLERARRLAGLSKPQSFQSI